MLHERKNLFWIINLLTLAALACSLPFQTSVRRAAPTTEPGGRIFQPGNRGDDPIVLAGSELPMFLGADPGKIVAFRFHNGWQQIAVQVDQRKMMDLAVIRADPPRGFKALVYADPNTLTGADDDPTFDANDELVFMAADAGEPAPPDAAPPAGVIASPSAQVFIRDPITKLAGILYLFVSQGKLSPGAGVENVTYRFHLISGKYPGSYHFQEGANPEDSAISTPNYRIHFSDRWVMDGLAPLAGGAPGVNILDRKKYLFAPGECGRSEDTFDAGGGGFIANLAGPVRAIRSYLGANSGYLTEQDDIFYARRMDLTASLRVHPIPGVLDIMDYSAAALGMRYFNDQAQMGALIDGKPEDLPGHALRWEMVTGNPGTVSWVYKVQTNIPSLAISSFYSDMETPDWKQCTGDAHAYGVSGLWIVQSLPNTDPLRSHERVDELRITRVGYFDPPNQPVQLAVQRAQSANTPFQVSVQVRP